MSKPPEMTSHRDVSSRHSGELLRIASWNVNGLRANFKNGRFLPWLEAHSLDIAGLQEVRAEACQLDTSLLTLPGWHHYFACAEKKGYSGVGIFSRLVPDAIETSLGMPEFDREGRYIEARFGALTVVSAYFPNGNGSTLPNGKRSNDRIPYKLDFYRAVFDRFEALRAKGGRVIVMGDYNTAHHDIDLARPKDNRQTSGFRDEERAEITRWLQAGWIDTFRHVHGKVEGRYSWWSNRSGAREKNIGWRIDMALCSQAVLPFLKDAFIEREVLGSDHCPIGVTLDRRILEASSDGQS